MAAGMVKGQLMAWFWTFSEQHNIGDDVFFLSNIYWRRPKILSGPAFGLFKNKLLKTISDDVFSFQYLLKML
jgi:hypothetical protein